VARLATGFPPLPPLLAFRTRKGEARSEGEFVSLLGQLFELVEALKQVWHAAARLACVRERTHPALLGALWIAELPPLRERIRVRCAKRLVRRAVCPLIAGNVPLRGLARDAGRRHGQHGFS
jgi:hypothetical protein